MAVQTSYSTQIDVLTGAATSTAGAATINTQTGQVTTEALATAAGAVYTFTLTNQVIKPTSIVNTVVGLGTATTGVPTVAYVTSGTGVATIVIQNIAAAAALNGTLKIGFVVFNVV
jgi:ABC-type branched-subunit amino acid transport system ATPase component